MDRYPTSARIKISRGKGISKKQMGREECPLWKLKAGSVHRVRQPQGFCDMTHSNYCKWHVHGLDQIQSERPPKASHALEFKSNCHTADTGLALRKMLIKIPPSPDKLGTEWLCSFGSKDPNKWAFAGYDITHRHCRLDPCFFERCCDFLHLAMRD